MRFQNRVALVTGGTKGIGYAAAKRLLTEGAIVHICSFDAREVEEAVQSLAAFGEVRGHIADISDRSAVSRMVENIVGESGRIDILINNAGITSDAQFYKMTDAQWDRVIDVNLKGTYHVSKAVVPHMQEQNYGRIVNLSSVSAYNGNFGQANYAASKAAIIGMTRVMGKELGKYGITVNAVAPGSIMTDMYAAVPEELKEKKLKAIPLRRYGTPEDASALLAFLASDDAAYITAQTITIDGGYN